MKTFWAFVLCVLGFYARGDQLTIPGTNIVNAITLNGGDLATALTNKLLNAAGSVSASNLATGAATNNIGYQPVNRAGDTMTGDLTLSTSGSKVLAPKLQASSAMYADTIAGYVGGIITIASSSGSVIIGGTGGLLLGADAASPTTGPVKSASGLGTDKSGAALTIQGGGATGTGGGGDVIVQTAIYTNSSGSTLRAYTTRSYDRAKPTALTDATTNLLFTVSLPAGCHVGGLLDATIFATDGTDFKSHNSAGVSFSAVNKGGTITASISESAQLETHSESVGTQMTDTWTVQQSGSTVAILVTPGVGSLMTPSTYNCKWGIVKMNSNGPATVTPN